jgi:hypothetical protein
VSSQVDIKVQSTKVHKTNCFRDNLIDMRSSNRICNTLLLCAYPSAQ